MNFPTDSPVLVLSKFCFIINVGRGLTASDEITASIKSVSGWHALYSYYMHPVARVSTRFSSRNTGGVRRMLMTQEPTKFHQLVDKTIHFFLFLFISFFIFLLFFFLMNQWIWWNCTRCKEFMCIKKKKNEAINVEQLNNERST